MTSRIKSKVNECTLLQVSIVTLALKQHPIDDIQKELILAGSN
jgi:hypothetical protein